MRHFLLALLGLAVLDLAGCNRPSEKMLVEEIFPISKMKFDNIPVAGEFGNITISDSTRVDSTGHVRFVTDYYKDVVFAVYPNRHYEITSMYFAGGGHVLTDSRLRLSSETSLREVAHVFPVAYRERVPDRFEDGSETITIATNLRTRAGHIRVVELLFVRDKLVSIDLI